jgi:predicted transport protein
VSDLKLFQIEEGTATEIVGAAMALEKPLQTLMERNMETLFGVRFLASEYSTGPKHGGRIDSLGLDENNSPVIFEYKRASNQTVINQGLFYLDWLLDHKAEFQLLVMKRLGGQAADIIDWTNPRLICVAADFTRYDEHAVLQINRSIELVRYRDYAGKHLALELLTSTTAKATAAGAPGPNGIGVTASPTMPAPAKGSVSKTVSELHAQAPQAVKDLFDSLEEYLLGLGDDVTKKVTSLYYAYRRLKNFACVEVHPQTGKILTYVKTRLPADQLEAGFTRDVTSIGHFGTGDLEIAIASREDLEKAKPLILASYEAN